METLGVHIDGVTYTAKRRKCKSGLMGFMFQAGAVVHGRKVWIQVLVIDRPELTPDQRIQKSAKNRARRQIRRRRLQLEKSASVTYKVDP